MPAQRARGLHRLTWRQAQTMTRPGRHADGGGLYLQVRKRGAELERLWLFRWRTGPREAQREQVASLGPVALVSLAEARAKAAEHRQAIARGQDPRRRRAPGVPTFGAIADAYVDRIAPGLASAKHLAQWRASLGAGLCRSLRALPVDAIDTRAVLEVLAPIWATRPETARRLRARLERVLDAATVDGHRSGPNPVRWRGHLAHTLPRLPALVGGHHRAMPWQDVPAFLEVLARHDTITARALEFTVLTAARTGETLGATWGELDLAGGVWAIPAARMKARRAHRVPLAPRVLELLAGLEAGPPGAPVFPGRHRGRPLSPSAMSACLAGIAPGVTVHGFRSAFRDWAAEATSYAGELAEAALAHTIANKVERAYRRGDLLERRRELMAAWARHCAGAGSARVLPLRRARSV